jgi:hypothetical protein
MLVNGVYGFDLPGGATDEFRSRLDAASAAVHFARGYRGCTAADRASTISLAIGTTNRGTQVRATSTARLLNAWQGRAGGGFVSVYAGAAADDANQGVVVVVTLEDARHPTFGQQLVKTRSRSGALRVAAANGSLLTLQAEGARTSPSTSPPGASGSGSPVGCGPSTDQRVCVSQPVGICCQPRPQTCVLGYWSTAASQGVPGIHVRSRR